MRVRVEVEEFGAIGMQDEQVERRRDRHGGRHQAGDFEVVAELRRPGLVPEESGRGRCRIFRPRARARISPDDSTTSDPATRYCSRRVGSQKAISANGCARAWRILSLRESAVTHRSRPHRCGGRRPTGRAGGLGIDRREEGNPRFRRLRTSAPPEGVDPGLAHRCPSISNGRPGMSANVAGAASSPSLSSGPSRPISGHFAGREDHDEDAADPAQHDRRHRPDQPRRRPDSNPPQLVRHADEDAVHRRHPAPHGVGRANLDQRRADHDADVVERAGQDEHQRTTGPDSTTGRRRSSPRRTPPRPAAGPAPRASSAGDGDQQGHENAPMDGAAAGPETRRADVEDVLREDRQSATPRRAGRRTGPA